MPRQDSVTSAKAGSRLVQIAATIVIIWALRYAKEVLVPIALAVLFSFLLAPLVHRLERARLPRAPAVLIVVLMAFACIGGVGVLVVRQVEDLGEHIPQYAGKLDAMVHRIKGHGGAMAKISDVAQKLAHEVAASQPAPTTRPAGDGPMNPFTGEVLAPGQYPKVEVVPATPSMYELLAGTFGPVLEVFATAFVVVVLCIFMLVGREDLRDRVIRLVSHGHLNVTTQAMDDAAKRVSRYLLVQAMLNGTYGVLVATGLFFIGVPSPLLWGLMACLLRFIPYVGPWLGAAMPVLLSFVTLGGHRALLTVGMYAALEVVVSTVLEPWLYGSHTGVSSIAILVAAAFWAWVWGGVGLLLATPLTVLLVVVGKYVPQLEFLGVMLGDEPVFDPATRYYQRLLASDQEEASELVQQYLKQMPLESVYESVMIPALGLAHRDRYRGRLDTERAERLREEMKDEIVEIGEQPPPAPVAPETVTKSAAKSAAADEVTPASLATINARRSGEEAAPAESVAPLRGSVPGAEHVQVLCLPARDEADELAGMMFAQVLARSGFKAEAVAASTLASEMLDLVGQKQADVVVISALPPAAVTHARYLCKRLHLKYPEIKLVVGLWTSTADLVEAKRKLTCTPGDVVVATFSDGFHQIEQLAHPLMLAKEDAALAAKQSPEEKAKMVHEVNRDLSPSTIGAAAEQRAAAGNR